VAISLPPGEGWTRPFEKITFKIMMSHFNINDVKVAEQLKDVWCERAGLQIVQERSLIEKIIKNFSYKGLSNILMLCDFGIMF
jgi:hypothetical protein